MSGFGRHIVLLFVLMPIMVEPSWSASGVADPVRHDWYFRESLAAIRDWEAILARWEEATPEEERTPRWPVPTSGEAVEWPNPIPLMLLPVDEQNCRVRVRLIDGQVEVERANQDAEVTRKTVAAGETVLGYKHPGGGAKDQWYHRYHRKFDRLTTFRPQPAPLALRLDTPLDLKQGTGELAAVLSNVADEPLTLTVQLQLHLPEQTHMCGREVISLSAGATQPVRFPVELRARCGGLLILTVECRGESFWVPLLTHVEDVASVLEGIEQILTDTPDAAAAAQLATLRRRAEENGRPNAADAGATWRTLFEEASRLRDELLLERIRFDTLLFLKRKPFFSEQPFMDAHHLFNRPGGGIYRLSPVCPQGEVKPVVQTLGEGVYRDVCLHWDAQNQKLLFSFGNGSDQWDGRQSYHIYEVGVDGTGIRQLTFGPKNDCEPFYLPNGQIGFTSDRSEHYVMCGANRHAPTLFTMNADGSEIRQLSFNAFNDFTPTLLPDGRILYGRWEYNERSVTSLHNPFTINPDGTMMAPYYGNATIKPNVIMFPRPVPESRKVTALFTAHHGQTHGAIGLIDVRHGIDGQKPITLLTPNVPITGEKAEDSRYGWYSDPVPLSETTYLCSFTPTVVPWLKRSWALYVGDRHGNLALVWRDPEISCAEPVPFVSRPRPHVLRPAGADTDALDAEATLLLADVYVGLTGVPRGTASYLRIIEDVPRKGVPQGGVIVTSGTLIFTIKRILGTVPIESDGSAHFVVPANRNIYFEVLDKDHLEIQRMRSVFCLKPNERRGCVGCHERRSMAPPDTVPVAFHRDPSRPNPPPWAAQILSYLRDVQPVLNAKCIRCHTHDRMVNRVILTDDLTDQFTVAYEELLPYLSVAISDRWDHPDDVYPRPPYTYGSKVSRLTKILTEGHHGVELTDEDWLRLVNWIDANGVYYDRYEQVYGPKRRIFTGPVREAMQRVYSRRCASCHGDGEGRHDTWWLSINRRDVTKSRALAAPLARSAGGWGRCDEEVFADAADPDYRTLLASLTSLRDALIERPRVDLLSIQGTEAQEQRVELPEPPPPRGPAEPGLPEGDWVHLSDLGWESGRSGWTPNKDGLPRLDRDITDKPMRLGLRRHRKGIGTHAPSEIVYQLDGAYSRFFAVVGAAETGGTVVFQVFGDENPLFDSGVMHGLRGSANIDVPVVGARRLRLVVTDAGDNYYADMANWADARLLKTTTGDKEQ